MTEGASRVSPEDRVRHAALVIVDMQNDFVRAGAPLEVPDARATIPAHHALIEVFRARGQPIVYTKFISHPEYYLLWEWSPECFPDTKCCWKGHVRTYEDAGALECTDIVGEIYPEPGDPIIEKFGYGAFHRTNLDQLLHERGIDAVVVTGTVTQICVEETAREAFHYGYKTTLVEDAVSSFDPELHAATLKNFAMKFGWVERSESLLARI
ncbi:MAG: cysteine hydrolase family protein [Alphaproteobacteria bacterium]